MSKLRVLVTGATGMHGGGVARHLLADGHFVRALTRDPGSKAAQALRELGAEVVGGSFADPASVTAAATGVDAAFAISTPYVSGPDAERQEALALIGALKAAKVGRIVFSSVSDVDRRTGIPHFESKWPAEEAVRASGAAWSIVAPTFYMENLIGPWWLPALQSGNWGMAMPADRKLQMIALADLARFSATVIEQPETFNGRRINLASDELSPAEANAILSRVTGRKLAYQGYPTSALREQNPDFADMFDFFNNVGYSADVPGLRREFPGIGWHSFEAWAKSLPWESLLATAAAR